MKMNDQANQTTLEKPLFLAKDNLTSLQQTPWAGVEISKYKQLKKEVQIGESWEISCDVKYPSTVLDSQETLSTWLQKYESELQLPSHRQFDVLVKLIDAALPLSLQVHPSDHDPFLSAQECGKHESWLILKATPMAGVYLGFQSGVTKQDVKQVLRRQGDLSLLMNFVDVAVGDYIEIQPGLVHAIGAGVTLLEAQHVKFMKSAKTYRLWDWNRRYSDLGRIDLRNGKSRELHQKACLRLLDLSFQSGESLVRRFKKQGSKQKVNSGIVIEAFPENEYYQVMVIQMNADQSVTLHLDKGYVGCCLLVGEFEVVRNCNRSRVNGCRSFVLSHHMAPLMMIAKTNLKLIVVRPTFSTVRWT